MPQAKQLSYTDSGTGDVLLLIHGFCGSQKYWQKIVPLLNQDFRVITVDLRGHGTNNAVGESFTIEDLAKDIAAFLSEEAIEKPVVFGHSLGGYTALAMAELYPDLLRGFSLVHSTAYPDDEQGKEERMRSIQTIEENGMTVFVDNLVPKLFADSDSPEQQEAVQLAKQIGLETDKEAAVQTLLAMRDRRDRNDVFQNTNLPVLLVAGKKDKVIAPEKTFSVKRPNIKEAVLEESGHMGMLEEPEKLAETIRNFVHSL
ncbi:alpha/beta fold hydrolase [Bacillus massiliglaciei]|uniref:alpha/beta fold hydrolase n=1 Tax=Bacillus massiliglaciei TaxID=1816693 RepID=UPI000AB61106|nr:alpha/beta hydrolase [Bacillus massiliglaciei]